MWSGTGLGARFAELLDEIASPGGVGSPGPIHGLLCYAAINLVDAGGPEDTVMKIGAGGQERCSRGTM
jgi:hypothetical protein